MIAPLAKLIEWASVQIMFRQMPHPEGQNLRLDEAIQFLKGPDFIPGESRPAQLVFDNASRFHFPTPRPGAFAENNVVYGQIYRCSERWQERPAIILLHGRNDSFSYQFKFPMVARRCKQAEFNAATLVLPYHFQRRPKQMRGWGGPNHMQIAEATAQGIAEIRALMGWLLKESCPAVALWGISMGAWYAGMVACRDARLAAVVLGAPCARMNPWLEQRAVRPRVRARLPMVRELCEGLNLTALNLLTAQPVIPAKNVY